MREELQSIWEKKKRTVLFVTHDVLEAVQLSDRIIPGDLGAQLRRHHRRPSLPAGADQPAVSTMQSEILAVFEDMESRRAQLDPRIVEAAESAS